MEKKIFSFLFNTVFYSGIPKETIRMPFRGLTMLKSRKLVIKGGLCYRFAMVHTGLKKKSKGHSYRLFASPTALTRSVGLVCGNDNGVDNTTAGNTHTCSLIGGHPSTTTRVMSHSMEQTQICTTDTILSVSQ